MSELAATADAVLLLVTSMPSTTIVEGAQANLRNIFRGKKIDVEEIDGVDANNKALRSEMFALSNLRGQYPQVFIRSGGTLKFVGDAEAVKSLNDCEDIPPEVLRDHPHIETFSKAFAAFLPETSAPPPPPAPSKRILEGIDNVMPSAHPTHHPSDGANATARRGPGGTRLHGPRPGARAALPDGLAGRRRDVHGRVEGRVHDSRAAGSLALGSTNSCDLHLP